MYEQLHSKLPFVDCIWHARIAKSEEFGDAAKETWGLAFTRHSDGTFAAELIGSSYRHRKLDAIEGDKYWGVEFNALVTVQNIDKRELTGHLVQLPVEGGLFQLGGVTHTIPLFDELNCFCSQLQEQGIIQYNESGITDTSMRSVRSNQRHYRKIIGLTKKQTQQIKRAEKAATLLRSGIRPIDVAVEAGYADQAHMTRALKTFLGETPAIIKKHQ